MNTIEHIEKKIDFVFKDKSLLKTALTHKSSVKSVEGNYERLEFIGDSVIGLAASFYLYKKYKTGNEGELSKKKDALVSLEACTMYAEYFSLDSYMLHCKGMKERAKHFKGDLFESLLGAIYIDAGFNVAYMFFEKMLNEVIKLYGMPNSRSCIAILQEYSHKLYKKVPDYVMVSSSGPEHEKVFEFDVYVNNTKCGNGFGSCKKSAKEIAAENALKFLGVESDE